MMTISFRGLRISIRGNHSTFFIKVLFLPRGMPSLNSLSTSYIAQELRGPCKGRYT